MCQKLLEHRGDRGWLPRHSAGQFSSPCCRLACKNLASGLAAPAIAAMVGRLDRLSLRSVRLLATRMHLVQNMDGRLQWVLLVNGTAKLSRPLPAESHLHQTCDLHQQCPKSVAERLDLVALTGERQEGQGMNRQPHLRKKVMVHPESTLTPSSARQLPVTQCSIQRGRCQGLGWNLWRLRSCLRGLAGHRAPIDRLCRPLGGPRSSSLWETCHQD